MAQKVRPRYVRRRVYDRLRHEVSNLRRFLVSEGARLAASATDRTFTADAGTDVFTSVGHGFETGKGPVEVANSGGALPAGLTADTDYYPIRLTDDTFQLALSRDDAAFGRAVDVTDAGTGTQTAAYRTEPQSILERLRQGVKPDTLRAATDIDSL